MLPSVDFDNQIRRAGNEVANVGADGALNIEANASNLPVSELTPQRKLGSGRVFPQFSGAKGGLDVVRFVQQALPNPSR